MNLSEPPPPDKRIQLSGRRELILGIEPGERPEPLYRLALVTDHGTYRMQAGGVGGLSRREMLELLMAFDKLAAEVDAGGLPGE